MIQRKDLLSLNFYKTTPFTGSDGAMRYRVEKVSGEGDGGPDLLQATVWRGPYAFAVSTEEKTRRTAPFSEEGLEELTAWMNQQTKNYGE